MQEMTPAQFRSTIADLQDALETERAERAKKARKTAALQEKLNETIKRHNASEIASTLGLKSGTRSTTDTRPKRGTQSRPEPAVGATITPSPAARRIAAAAAVRTA
jgi:low affinity Fe/Cu permease